jgi:hypothetical protein
MPACGPLCVSFTDMKQLLKKYKTLLPNLILTLLCIWTILSFFIIDITLTWEHIVAFILVTTNFFVYFKYRTFYRYFLITTLLLGLLNLINFTPYISRLNITLGSLSLNFQLISFLICVFTVLTNLPKKADVVVVSSEKTSIDNQQRYFDDVIRFKSIYLNKSSDDLKQIISDKRFTESAKDAARKVLEERGT